MTTGRVGLGPVFAYEWLTTARKWQVYAARAGFVAVLLCGLALVYVTQRQQIQTSSIRGQAEVGRQFYAAIIGIEIALVLLAAPAATAGSICLDKARGTLAHVLVTDLSDPEIVLGKLAARLVPVLGLVACTLPVLALGTLMGGIDPVMMTGALMVTAAVAVLGCATALALSVWGTKPHEVLLVNLVIWCLWIGAIPLQMIASNAFGWGTWYPEWMLWTNPFWLAITPAMEPGSAGLVEQGIFAGSLLVISAGLAGLATVKVRSVALRQAGQGPKRALKWKLGRRDPSRPPLRLPGPSLDANPVLWREWHRRRPSLWSGLAWLVYGLMAVGVTLHGISAAWQGNRGGMDFGAVGVGLVVSFGLLLLSVTAATSLAEERTRGSLDVLMATPLSTPTILWAKWWGTFRTVPLLAIGPALVGLAYGLQSWSLSDGLTKALAYHESTESLIGSVLVFLGHGVRDGRLLGGLLIGPIVLAYGAALTSLGLALATWVSRLGRAVALTTGTFVVVAVGGMFVAMMLFSGNNQVGPGMAAISPFWGTGFYSAVIAGTGGPADMYRVMIGWSIFWMLAYSTTAAALLAATLATFNRCLGRMDEGPPLVVAKPIPAGDFEFVAGPAPAPDDRRAIILATARQRSAPPPAPWTAPADLGLTQGEGSRDTPSGVGAAG